VRAKSPLLREESAWFVRLVHWFVLDQAQVCPTSTLCFTCSPRASRASARGARASVVARSRRWNAKVCRGITGAKRRILGS